MKLNPTVSIQTSLYLFLMWQTGNAVFGGACDCQESRQTHTFILNSQPQGQCLFCGRTVQLALVPHYRAIESDGEWLIVTDSGSPS